MEKNENGRKVKLKVEDLTIIFGKNKEKAQELLDKGFSKKKFLKKQAVPLGSTKQVLKSMKVNSLSSWDCQEAENLPCCAVSTGLMSLHREKYTSMTMISPVKIIKNCCK